jgi:hypothetical protein
MDTETEIQSQLEVLLARIEQLEQRVEILEKEKSSGRIATTTLADGGATISGGVTPSAVAGDAMIEGIRAAFAQIGEGDAGAVRQQLAKNPQFAGITRSDVNKALYAHKDIFTIARQEGMKPIWKLLA